MKTLSNYIIEKFETYRLGDLRVIFSVNDGDEITFEVPQRYGEDDFMIYLGDTLGKQFPCGEDSTASLSKISDDLLVADFLYEKYERTDEKPSGDIIEFDKKYDTSIDEDEAMTYVTISGMTYDMQFDKVDIDVESQDKIEETLDDIINMSVETFNNENTYGFEISLAEKSYK